MDSSNIPHEEQAQAVKQLSYDLMFGSHSEVQSLGGQEDVALQKRRDFSGIGDDNFVNNSLNAPENATEDHERLEALLGPDITVAPAHAGPGADPFLSMAELDAAGCDNFDGLDETMAAPGTTWQKEIAGTARDPYTGEEYDLLVDCPPEAQKMQTQSAQQSDLRLRVLQGGGTMLKNTEEEPHKTEVPAAPPDADASLGDFHNLSHGVSKRQKEHNFDQIYLNQTHNQEEPEHFHERPVNYTGYQDEAPHTSRLFGGAVPHTKRQIYAKPQQQAAKRLLTEDLVSEVLHDGENRERLRRQRPRGRDQSRRNPRATFQRAVDGDASDVADGILPRASHRTDNQRQIRVLRAPQNEEGKRHQIRDVLLSDQSVSSHRRGLEFHCRDTNSHQLAWGALPFEDDGARPTDVTAGKEFADVGTAATMGRLRSVLPEGEAQRLANQKAGEIQVQRQRVAKHLRAQDVETVNLRGGEAVDRDEAPPISTQQTRRSQVGSRQRTVELHRGDKNLMAPPKSELDRDTAQDMYQRRYEEDTRDARRGEALDRPLDKTSQCLMTEEVREAVQSETMRDHEAARARSELPPPEDEEDPVRVLSSAHLDATLPLLDAPLPDTEAPQASRPPPETEEKAAALGRAQRHRSLADHNAVIEDPLAKTKRLTKAEMDSLGPERCLRGPRLPVPSADLNAVTQSSCAKTAAKMATDHVRHEALLETERLAAGAGRVTQRALNVGSETRDTKKDITQDTRQMRRGDGWATQQAAGRRRELEGAQGGRRQRGTQLQSHVPTADMIAPTARRGAGDASTKSRKLGPPTVAVGMLPGSTGDSAVWLGGMANPDPKYGRNKRSHQEQLRRTTTPNLLHHTTVAHVGGNYVGFVGFAEPNTEARARGGKEDRQRLSHAGTEDTCRLGSLSLTAESPVRAWPTQLPGAVETALTFTEDSSDRGTEPQRDSLMSPFLRGAVPTSAMSDYTAC